MPSISQGSEALLAPEIIWFTPSDDFVRDPDEFMRKVDGVEDNGILGNFHGTDIGNPNSRVWVMVWKSLKHQEECMSREAYIDVAIPVMEAMVGQGEITQILLDDLSDLEAALSAPVTQIVYIVLKPFQDRGYALGPYIEKIKKELLDVAGCVASCWGPSVEKDKLQVGIIGWKSMRHRDEAAEGGKVGQTIKSILDMGGMERRYVNFA